MADEKSSTKYYQLKGVNTKSSKYEFPEAEALALYNLDFDTQNAWQKRPGSTFAIGSSLGTSGPISALFEFSKLTGESYIVASSDTALSYIANNGLTLLSPGWNNGQPVDMLTFVNKLWAANGQKSSWYNGSSFLPAGLPIQPLLVSSIYPAAANDYQGATWALVGGHTAYYYAGASMGPVGVYMAYSYLRTDGYMGTADFLKTARNLVMVPPQISGSEVFAGASSSPIGGFTIPTGYGITAIALWIALDQVTTASPTESIAGVGSVQAGNLGWLINVPYAGYSMTGTYAGASAGTWTNTRFMSVTLKPGADMSRFWLYTLIPSASLFLANGGFNNVLMNGGGQTYYAANFTFYNPGFNQIFPSYTLFDGVAPGAAAFSGMTFDFFSTYTPKYIEVNQNIMFSAGFSTAPSTVWYSEVGDPETYLPESSFETRTNDGDRVFAIKAFNNQLIVMKENSFHKLIGDTADNFQLVEISTQYGCLSNKSVVQVKQSIFWLDKKGILEFNGASFDIVSTPVEQIFKRMNISAAKEKACSVHHLYRNQIWFGIPIDGSTVNNMTVVYDYLIGGWTFFDGFNPSSFAYIKGPLSKPTMWRGDYSGMIHYGGESFFGDSGRGISCVALTRFENVGGENQTTLWRRFFLDVGANSSGVTGQINCQFFSNYDSSTVQATFAMYQSQFQTRAEIGVNGKAAAAQISHSSASLPLLINGYAWATRGLRNV